MVIWATILSGKMEIVDKFKINLIGLEELDDFMGCREYKR